MKLDKILFLFLVCGIVLSGHIMFAKRVAPSISENELSQLKQMFIQAVKTDDWQQVIQFTKHPNAWVFVDVAIPNTIMPDSFGATAEEPITALDIALFWGHLDAAEELIKAAGAYCQSKNRLLTYFKQELNKQIEEDHNAVRQGIAKNSEDEVRITKAKEVLQLLEEANSRCI